MFIGIFFREIYFVNIKTSDTYKNYIFFFYYNSHNNKKVLPLWVLFRSLMRVYLSKDGFIYFIRLFMVVFILQIVKNYNKVSSVKALLFLTNFKFHQFIFCCFSYFKFISGAKSFYYALYRLREVIFFKEHINSPTCQYESL